MGKTYKDKEKFRRKHREPDDEDRYRKSRKNVDEPDPMEVEDLDDEETWWDDYYVDHL